MLGRRFFPGVFVVAIMIAGCQTHADMAGLKLDFDTNNPALKLHNGAQIVPTDGGHALSLNAEQQQYATLQADLPIETLGGVRLEARVRLQRPGPGQVPIGRPGACMLYIDGACKPRWIVWTQKGRSSYASDQALQVGRWHHIVFNYRNDGNAAIIVDGKTVAMRPAAGPIADSGREWTIGRYEWEEDGKRNYSYFTGQIDEVVVAAPMEDSKLPGIDKVKICQRFSWGDIILSGQADSKDKIRATLEAAKGRGVTAVIWRLSAACLRDYYVYLPKEKLAPYMVEYNQIVDEVFKQFDPIAYAIEQCHDLGMKCYGWLTIFDEGAPGESVKYADTTPFPWQSKFTKEHPYTCVVDRDGKPQWGVIEYAYPEARKYKVNMIVDYMTRYSDLDGVFISTRSHSNPAMEGDRFGFNEPIVKEFEKRYGVDILKSDDFDKEAWRRLRGEQVTKLLRELRKAMPEGKRVWIGIPRGDHWGPPYGNLFIDWRTWVREGLVDGLIVGEITGKGLYPQRKDYRGYIFDQEARVGVRPLREDMEEVFGPLCKGSGVQLYLMSSDFSQAIPYIDDGLKGVCM